jgi:hypothetical protein
MQKSQNRDHRDFGWGNAHSPVFATPADLPRHDGTPYRGCAYDVGVWILSIVHGPFSVAPCQPLT